jgi:type VI secretion system secreted protein Hcp
MMSSAPHRPGEENWFAVPDFSPPWSTNYDSDNVKGVLKMAAVDYFLKIDNVDGESKDSAHGGEIELMSFSWGEVQGTLSGVGQGRSAGKVSMQDFHFVMNVNKASPKLMMACAGGDHLGQAVLTCRKAGAGGDPQEYLIWTFSDVMVSSYQTGGSGGDVVPVDQISLNYSKVKVEYKPQKDDGSLDSAVKGGWSLETNKKEA